MNEKSDSEKQDGIDFVNSCGETGWGPFGIEDEDDPRGLGRCAGDYNPCEEIEISSKLQPSTEVFLPNGEPNMIFWSEREYDIFKTIQQIDALVDSGSGDNYVLACEKLGISLGDYQRCCEWVEKHIPSVDVNVNVSVENILHNPYLNMTDAELGAWDSAIQICKLDSGGLRNTGFEIGALEQESTSAARIAIGKRALSERGVILGEDYINEELADFMQKFYGNTETARANREEALSLIKEAKNRLKQTSKK